MPALSPIQTSFTSGEVSGRVRGRIETPLYKTGLAYCSNFEPLPQGPIRMRAGTEYKTTLTGADENVRLLPFRLANEQDYLVALLDRKMRVYSIDGAAVNLELLTGTELVQNGDFTLGSSGWTGSPDFLANPDYDYFVAGADGHVHIGYPSSATGYNVYITQTIVLSAAADLAIKAVFQNAFSPAQFYIHIGTTPGGNDVLNIQDTHSKNYPVKDYFLTAVPADTYYLTIGHPETAGTFAPDLAKFDLTNFSILATFQEPQPDLPTPWSAAEVKDVQYVSETSFDRTVFVHPNYPPVFLQITNGVWSFGDLALTSPPTEWTGSNWPGVVELYQGRIILGATPNERNRFWGSKSGELFDFGLGVSNPGDGFDYRIATKGAIRWFQSGRLLLCGTDLGEHSIIASTGVLAPGDVQVRSESAYGSARRVQALDAGDRALYVSGDRRKVRSILYDQQSDGWNSKDVTFIAEHITEGLVKELLFARDPTGTIITVLDDGTLACCTYDPTENLAAWYRLSFPGATVLSGAVSHGDAGSYLWLAVLRGAEVHLELLPLHDTEARYLDACVVATLTLGATTVTGLDHLEGATVGVVADGAWVGEKTVVGGEITLDETATEVIVGLRYTATARTLPLEGGNPKGTSQGFKVHYTDIAVRVNNSAPPLLQGTRAGAGRAFATLESVPGAPPVSRDLRVKNVKVEEGGEIVIEQDMPFHTEVCAVYAQAHVSKV